MKKILLFAGVIYFLFSTSCDLTNTNAQPSKKVCFNTSETSCNVDDCRIEFDASCTDFDVSNYQWDFDGDGQFDIEGETEEVVEYTYQTEGTFEAKLTITTVSGETKSIVKTIQVMGNNPVANFSKTSGAIYEQCEVYFNNYSQNATSFIWDFGDGNTSTEEEPIHTYSNAGTYTVRLRVSNGTEQDEHTESIDISQVIKFEDVRSSGNNNPYSSVAQAADGGYFLGVETLVGDSRDGRIIKINKDGNVGWEVSFEGGVSDVVASSNNTCVAAGYKLVNGTPRAYLFKINSDGIVLWENLYTTHVGFSAMTRTSNGGYIAVGFISTQSGEDLYVVVTNSSGAKLYDWAHSDFDPPSDISAAPNNGFIVTGHSLDSYMARLSSTGDLIWKREDISDHSMRTITSSTSTEGGYFMAGNSQIDLTTYARIVKTTINGGFLWDRKYGRGSFRSIIPADDGGYILSGNGRSNGSNAFRLTKINESGDVIWEKLYQEINSFVNPNGLAKTDDCGYVIAGGMNYPSQYVLIKTDALGNTN